MFWLYSERRETWMEVISSGDQITDRVDSISIQASGWDRSMLKLAKLGSTMETSTPADDLAIKRIHGLRVLMTGLRIF